MSDSDDESATIERSTVDQELVKSANELLDSFEQAHRSDLALHLYSSYLLKNLLHRANDKKYAYELERFVRTQIRESWARWPDPRTVVDPQVDRLYEDDNYDEGQEFCPQPGEISSKAYLHAANMLRMELDSFWQHSLVQSSTEAGEALDVDRISMPRDLADHVMWKMDHFFNGLHDKVAAKNVIDIEQDQTSQQVTVSQRHNEKVKANNRTELTYHDIIARGCEMGEDMEEIYMKSLELFNDIPSSFDKNLYKLPKQLLKSFRSTWPERSSLGTMGRSRANYINLEKLLKDKRMLSNDRVHLKKITKRATEQNLSRKAFFSVQTANIYQKGTQGDDDGDSDSYGRDDCLVRIPRLNR